MACGKAVETQSFVVTTKGGSVTASFVNNESVVGEKYNGVRNVIISGGKISAENLRTGQIITAELAALSGNGVTATVTLGPLGEIVFTSGSSAPIDDTDFLNISGQIVVTGAVDERPDVWKQVAELNGEQVVIETGQTVLNFKSGGISVKLKDSMVADSKTLQAGQTGVLMSTITVAVTKNEGKNLVIQTGANEGDNIRINMAKMDAYTLGIASANIANRFDASVATTQVNTALNIVSTQRATLGALQNRLEFKIANLDIGAENLQAAESRIRDVDMAKEMTFFTKNNILFQASTAMLAQANALPQGVLQLLG
jgi:flagellin-like hook-associated protein FlgL